MNMAPFKFDATMFGDDPDTRRLWQNYQLTITPRFHAVLAVLLLLATIRNFFGGETYAGTLSMALMLIATVAAARLYASWFLPLARASSFAFMALVAWNYFQWPTDYPPPTLIMLPVTVLVAVFADHLLMCTLFLLMSSGLLLHAASKVPPGAVDQYELLLAFAVTVGMLYVSAVLLWFLLHGLFTSRARLSETLKAAVTLRQSLLSVFFDKFLAPLTRLDKHLRSDSVPWQDAERAATEITCALGEARKLTLALSSPSSHDYAGGELEQLRNRVWTFVLYGGVAACLLIVVLGLSGTLVIHAPELAAACLLSLLLLAGRRHTLTARSRLVTIYCVTGFIAAACILSMVEQQPPYQLLYFYITIFCAAFMCGSRHSAFIAVIALAMLALWYLADPPLAGAAGYMRSNFLLALLFMLAFSHIVWIWLREALSDIALQQARLRAESDTRNRLMATLFHDIANPLHAIHGTVELALTDPTHTPDLDLLRNLTQKIRALISFTREFDELEQNGGTLHVEAVELAPLFADLKTSFADMLAAKELKLDIGESAPAVLAHEAILGTSVLSNLLTNAIKFSPRGGTIRIGAEMVPEGRVRISMRDDGGGLPPDIALKLRRGDTVRSTSGTEGERGDGQGLRLVMLYLNRMNGNLVLDQGGLVAVELPLAG